MTQYSQGIAGDGPCILMDGMPLTPEEIVNSLNHKTHAIKRLKELLEQHAPGIFDDNNIPGLSKDWKDQMIQDQGLEE